MFRAWYKPFYEYGVIHGDPHLGNYTVRSDLDINLLDFGCIRVFPASFVKGVIDLYWALARGDRDLAVHAYETWGFRNLKPEVIDILNEWAGFLYAPLLEDKPRLIQAAERRTEGRDVAGRVHQRLRETGGVTPPREFVFMDRAAVGLGSVFMHLKAEVNWYQLFMELIADFDVDRLAARQKAGAGAARAAGAGLTPGLLQPAGTPSVRGAATREVEHGASAEAAFVRGEPCCQRRDLLRPAEAAHRAFRDHDADVLLRHLPEQGRLDRGRCHRVAEHARPGQFLAERLGECHHPRLGGTVGGGVGRALLPASEAMLTMRPHPCAASPGQRRGSSGTRRPG